MKKILLLTLFFLNFSYFCYSQESRQERIRSIQIAYLTEHLQLTPEEATKFWPIYNKYNSEVRQARKESAGDVVASNKKVANVQEKYQTEFKKVFSDPNRVNKVFKVEEEFSNKLRKELQERRNKDNTGKGSNDKSLNLDKGRKQKGKGL